MTEIETECIRRIAEVKGIPADGIEPDTTLESLAVDSLDRVSLAFDLEEKYGVEIPESKLHSIRTVRDVASAVEEAMLAKKADGAENKAGSA